MIRFTSDMDLAQEFIDRWNQKLRSARTASFITSVIMIILGILCTIYPMQAITVIEVLVCILLMVLGIYEIVDYCREPVWFRNPGIMVSGILNIMMSIILIGSPRDITISTFSFLFGWMLMMAGIEMISLGNKLAFFSVSNYGWLTASGIFNIIAALLFIFVPMASALALNFILAAYLFVGGITLLIEAFSMKDLKIKEDGGTHDDNIIDI